MAGGVLINFKYGQNQGAVRGAPLLEVVTVSASAILVLRDLRQHIDHVPMGKCLCLCLSYQHYNVCDCVSLF